MSGGFKMKYYRLLISLLLLFAITFATAATAESTLDGFWVGTLDISGQKLRLVFNIKQKSEGVYTAFLDSPDQGSYYLPVDTVTFDSNRIHIVAVSLDVVIDGEYIADSNRIECEFVQFGRALPLILEKTDTAPTVNRPQNPVPPFTYNVEEVTFENSSAGIKLAGTLTIPDTESRYPAVVMITGSGAQDRDETIFGHKPFWVIADYLTRKGIAVLRYDDRGFGKSTGDYATATSEDFASDVLAAVTYLKQHNKIDAKQIGLVGHSEGAIIAPMVAAQNFEIAFAVLLAASGVIGEEILYEQTELINKANGVSDFLINWNRSMQIEFFNTLKTESDPDSARTKIRAMMIDKVNMLTDEEKQTLGLTEQIVTSQIESFTSLWFKAFLTYDPIPTLQRVSCPLLVLYGELDLQTPPEQNAGAVEQALKEAGHSDFSIRILPGKNHLFQTAAVGSPKVYGMITETFSPEALELISGWILERVE